MANIMTPRKAYDCVVIGGGPAGSTAASVLAQQGCKVALLEKNPGPRYQIGESLLPFCYQTLERIGVLDQIKSFGFTKKLSVQFVSADGHNSKPFFFDQHLDHPATTTWQVRRSEFDELLLENAQRLGVEILRGTTAQAPITDDSGNIGLIARDHLGEQLELHAPMTIDASGRECFFVRHYRWRKSEPALNRLALWAYFEGAQRDAGRNEGATTIARMPDDGWFWYIPLHEDKVSVGVVAQADSLLLGESDPQEIFEVACSKNPWIRERLEVGKQCTSVRMVSDYSYGSRYCATDGVLLCGDAVVFMDPVFSTGIFLALRSGEAAGDAAFRALSTGNFQASQFTDYGVWLKKTLTPLRRLIFAFYDPNFSFSALSRNFPHLAGDITDCLIGNVDRDFSELYAALDSFTARPPEPEYGTPFLERP